MKTNVTITTRTHHNGRLAAVRRAVLRSGNPSQITLPGGTVRKQSYDGLLRLKDLNVIDPGQSQVMSYQYNYDLTNNLVAKATEAGATSYSYDRLDRLTGAAYTGSTQINEAYTYDAVANRLTDTKTTGALSYNANNQLTAAGSVSYSYDANGNTINQTDSATTGNTRNYVYDTSDRLIQVRDANNTLIAVYSYDPFGRRLSKDSGTQKTFYLYNEEGLIAEADATGQVTKSYGYAPNSTYMTNPLFMKTGANYYYYQNDHLGTPQKLVTQSGQVVWSATYDAFGSATVGAGYTLTNNLRLPGQYYDAETGMHYNWMRYYDPKTGRYVTSDPIGLAGGVNLYTYVGGNPVSWVDPLGLKTYMCTRKLHNVFFRVGPLYHQYICVPDGKGGQTCGGLSPSGKMFDSPGVIEYENKSSSSSSSCEKVADDNQCTEKCIQDEFKKPPPNYSVDLSEGQNCQTWADSTVFVCKVKCEGKK
jgi:RHS repeat-associated protein